MLTRQLRNLVDADSRAPHAHRLICESLQIITQYRRTMKAVKRAVQFKSLFQSVRYLPGLYPPISGPTPTPLPCVGHISTLPLLLNYTISIVCNYYLVTDQ